MIIDYTQKKESIEVSYVDDNNNICLDEIQLKDGFFKYVECEEDDSNKIEGKLSFHGNPIKKEKAHYFKDHNINEFFTNELETEYPDFFEKFSKLNEPSPFSVDIEVLPTKEFGYSPADKAQNMVQSISFTDKNLNSLLYIVKNPDHPEFNDIDTNYIAGIIRENLGAHADVYDYKFAIKVFDTEAEMLNTFLECVNKYFHLMFGWYFLVFDWHYIHTRCNNLGIDIKKASPNRKLTKKKLKINKQLGIDIAVPSHRILVDYMQLFKDSLVYNNLGSYSLNSISQLVLKLDKVGYAEEGNLLELYQKKYLDFIAYCFVDTILPMLLHKTTNLLTIDFFQSFYTKVPYNKITQNSISEALVYQELLETHMFLLDTEKTGNQKRPYKGGFVKEPTQKIVEGIFGIDAKALYPNGMITGGLSPEAKIDEIKTNELGKPINETENQKWLKYKSLGYTLIPTGRIYDTTKEYLYTKIEKKLLAQRGIFQGHMTEIYLNIKTKIENQIKQLK